MDDGKIWCVYRHINKINDKVYIGITSDIKRRWHNNGAEYVAKSSPFGRAILKYGWDGFTHEIVQSNLSLKEANELEMRLIDIHKCSLRRYHSPSFGYNQTDGGDGTKGLSRYGEMNPFYNHTHSNETKELLRRANSNKFVGSSSPLYGTTLPSEQKEAISQSLKNWYKNNKAHSNKRVYCITDGIWFDSTRSAEEHYGLYRGSISACCTGRRKTAGGKQWSYNEKILPLHICKSHDDLEWRRKIAKAKCIPVICIETGIIYSSAKEAAIQIGHSNGSDIGKCCKGKLKTAGGYHWEYSEDDKYG